MGNSSSNTKNKNNAGWKSNINRKKFVEHPLHEETGEIPASNNKNNKIIFTRNYNKTRSNYLSNRLNTRNARSTRNARNTLNTQANETIYMDTMKIIYTAYKYFDLDQNYTYSSFATRFIDAFSGGFHGGMLEKLQGFSMKYNTPVSIHSIISIVDKFYKYELLQNNNTPERILNIKIFVKILLRSFLYSVVDHLGNLNNLNNTKKCPVTIPVFKRLAMLATDSTILNPLHRYHSTGFINLKEYLNFSPKLMSCFDPYKSIWNRRKFAIIYK
jgi:hypothetical protein